MSQKKKQEIRIPAARLPIPERTLNWLIPVVLFILPFILYRDYLTGARMLYGSDFIGSGGYAARRFLADYVVSHHFSWPYWFYPIYCGLPIVAGIGVLGDIFYPLTVLLRLLMSVHVAWTYTFVLHVFLGGLGTYLFLRELKVPKVASFLMALAFMFSGSVISTTHEGHDGRLICTTLFPLVLFFLERGVNTRKLIHFLLAGTMIALQMFSSHIQQAYYTGLIAVIYFVYRLFDQRRTENRDATVFAAKTGGVPIFPRSLRLVGYFVVMMIFAGCLMAIQYLPAVGAGIGSGMRGSNRGWEFATSWAMPPEETFDLITPKFSGGLDHYWGRNPFKHHTEYLGILPILLALIGIIFCWRERITKFLTGLLAFSLLLAWGGHTPFYYIPYYLFPGIAKFRAPSLIFFVSTFTIVALGGIGLKFLLGENRDATVFAAKTGGVPIFKLNRFLLWLAGTSIGLLIIFAVAQGGIISLLSGISHSDPNRISANYGSFLGGMAVAVVLILVNAGLIYALIRRRVKPLVFAGITGLVLIIDTWTVDSKFIKSCPQPSESFAADEVVKFCKQDTTQFRVFPLYYQDQQTGENKADDGILLLHDIQSIGGQNPNPLRTYMEFVGLENTVMFQWPPNLLHRNFLDLLNVKYVIRTQDLSGYPPEYQRRLRDLTQQYISEPGLTQTYYSPRVAIYRNDSVLPRAFLVGRYEVLPEKDQVISRLKDPLFKPRNTVILAENPAEAHENRDATVFAAKTGGVPIFLSEAKNLTHPVSGAAVIRNYDANRLVVEATLDAPGFLVLSENYHPDWRALDNGKPTKIYRAYHTLRAVYLDAGSHTVEFRCVPNHFGLGKLLSLGALIFLIVVGALSVAASRRPSMPKHGRPEQSHEFGT